MRAAALAAILVITTSSLLPGCASGTRVPRVSSETTGTIVEAVSAENDADREIADAEVGGLVGNRSGADVDDETRILYLNAQNRALENGSSEEWYNEDRGDRGTIKVGHHYFREQRECRPYDSIVWISGHGEKNIGTACRNPDGTWSPI